MKKRKKFSTRSEYPTRFYIDRGTGEIFQASRLTKAQKENSRYEFITQMFRDTNNRIDIHPIVLAEISPTTGWTVTVFADGKVNTHSITRFDIPASEMDAYIQMQLRRTEEINDEDRYVDGYAD